VKLNLFPQWQKSDEMMNRVDGLSKYGERILAYLVDISSLIGPTMIGMILISRPKVFAR
jgi:hypothetical protein